jgi:hypothetical protein
VIALKTIVATAVIVFALTTVAMAGVQHHAKAQGNQVTPSMQRTGNQALGARSPHKNSAAHQAQSHVKHASVGHGGGKGISGGQSGVHRYERSHHVHVSGTSHAGDCGDNRGQCGD